MATFLIRLRWWPDVCPGKGAFSLPGWLTSRSLGDGVQLLRKQRPGAFTLKHNVPICISYAGRSCNDSPDTIIRQIIRRNDHRRVKDALCILLRNQRVGGLEPPRQLAEQVEHDIRVFAQNVVQGGG